MAASGLGNQGKGVDFSKQVPNTVSGKDRQVTVGEVSKYEYSNVNISSSGAIRAEKYSMNWKSADLDKAIKDFAGDNPIISLTKTGKRIYENPVTKIQVVEDLSGKYFRIYNPEIKGKRPYLDLNGQVPNNKTLDNGKKTGMNQGEYNQDTHFKIEGK